MLLLLLLLLDYSCGLKLKVITARSHPYLVVVEQVVTELDGVSGEESQGRLEHLKATVFDLCVQTPAGKLKDVKGMSRTCNDTRQ